MKDIEVSMGAECDKEYVAELDSCCSVLELQRFTEKWSWLAPDANEITKTMTPDDFKAFRQWRESEKRGEFMGEMLADIFSPILMPSKLFRVSVTALKFHVPWGVAYNRLKNEGLL